jgi:hypothetical protein
MQQNNIDKKIAKITILTVILVLCLTLITPAISKKPQKIIEKQVSNQGSIRRSEGIEIYSDKKGTNRINSIDWGTLNPGTTKTITIFVQNTGKDPITLSYYASNWNPTEIEKYLILNWDYNEQIIEFKEKIQITFSLTVSENIQTNTNFNFDIDIVKTQQI